jgi:hypothetical protein
MTNFYLQVISAYIQLMRHEEHLIHREGRDVYLENTFMTQLLWRDGATDAAKLDYSKDDKVKEWTYNYLNADMVSLTPISECCHFFVHWSM